MSACNLCGNTNKKGVVVVFFGLFVVVFSLGRCYVEL